MQQARVKGKLSIMRAILSVSFQLWKGCACLFLLVVLHHLSFAQQSNAGANVYAVVVGISDYQNAGIDKLDFAHKDAEVFADYLKSASGGSVPADHIILLQNEKATYSAIYNALDWLVETCKENDLVYFYFSGHGDMESSTIYKLGFLISYNTPRTNYINNAVRIEDLNNYANTLSIKQKARVVLITDACHSGNLAGNDFKGNLLVGEQLKAIINNEIRITSCAPDQLSVEDKKWGGGRGVFSYHLINGLSGKAEDKKDGTISVKEISDYLQKSMSNDPILKAKKHTQTPVIKGQNDFKLSSVDRNSLDILQNDMSSTEVSVSIILPPLPKNAMASFFAILEKETIENYIDFKAVAHLPARELAMQIVENVRMKFDMSDSVNLKKSGIDISALATLEKQLGSNPDILKKFNKKLVECISTRGQDIINQYLDGDEQEIERRRYYNTIANDYSIYPTMFQIALKLTEPNTPLAKILKIKYHYFLAVSCRLQIYRTPNTDSVLAIALSEQLKALALEENAAYIHNDLGVLYNVKGDKVKATEYFLKAIEITPKWVLPYSNLVNVYNATEQPEKATALSLKVDSLQKNFYSNQVNKGSIYEKKGNYLLAEEFFRKSILLNSRHFFPFERLGNVYTQTTNYTLADSFYHEAEIRKLGFNSTILMIASPLFNEDGVIAELDKPCRIPDKINDNDIITYFVKGKQLQFEDPALAEAMFKKVIAIDPSNPLAFQYLGKMMWRQQRWQEVDVYLNFAIKYYRDSSSFVRYCDSVKKFMTVQDACIFKSFRQSHYHRLEDYFVLADAYEKWNHFSEAEQLYRQVMQMDSLYSGAYHKLWNLMEGLKRYHDAEMVLLKYRPLFQDGMSQLNAFYRRVAKALPSSGEWFYKAGNFHYFEAILHPELYQDDTYTFVADADVSGLPDNTLGTLDSDITYDDYKMKIHGTGDITKMGEIVHHPKRRSILYLLKADSLLYENEMLADINAKIGDLYVALNSTANAFPHYQKSSSLQGVNAGTRLKLIDTWHENYYFQDAMKQLDTLWMRGEINFDKLVLYARYRIHSGSYADADTVLHRARQIHPYKRYDIEDLNGRRYLMAKQYDQAFTYYKAYAETFPSDASTMYTLAKICYHTGKVTECYDWLKRSINEGFNCYWVLKYDATWDKERASQQWITLTAPIKHKPFPETGDIIKAIR